MAVTVTCPGCATSMAVSEDLLGNKLRCKTCKETFVAAASKVAAGGRVDERIQAKPSGSRPRTTGQPAPAIISKAKTESKSGNGMLLAAGGGLFAVLAGVTVWALFLRGGDKPADPVVAAKANAGAGSKLNLNDAPPPVDITEKDKVKPDAEKAKSADVEVKTVPVRTGPADFVPNPLRLPHSISPATIEKVKKSSAWIRVGAADGGGTGSGWFAEPGIIVTNSHVVGMKEPAQPAPHWIKVVLDSGMASQRTFDAKLLGLDRENDLAVLKIEGDNLPPPMPIGRSSELSDGQKLFTIGFPRPDDVASVAKGIFEGEQQVVHTVKARETHVAGRFSLPSGGVKYIQGEGGSDQGNSGGMIVDTNGIVRCMVVAGIGSEAIEFFIPIEYPVLLLQGRILKLIPAQCYEANGKVRQELTALVADPMKRIKRVTLEMWTGESGKKMRPASNGAPSPLPGDSPRQSVELAYDCNTPVPIGDAIEAKGEWDVLPLKEGKVYWVQPKYTRFDGSEKWGEAVTLPMGGIPVQRKPAMLKMKFTPDTERPVTIESQMAVGGSQEHGELHLRGHHVHFNINEKTLAVQPDGGAKMRLSYSKLRFHDAETDDAYRSQMRGMLELMSKVSTDLTLTPRGTIQAPKANLQKIPVDARPFVERFNLQALQSLEALTLNLPGREVQPGETWKLDVNQSIVLSKEISENALYQLTCRYDGVRVRDGREEAVVEFEGKVARGDGNTASLPPTIDPASKGGDKKDKPIQSRGIHGYARGAAIIDLQTGTVSLARRISEVEFHVSYGDENIKFGAGMRAELHREVTKGALNWEAARLLPNQELLMTPFVGASDVSLTAAP